MVEEVGRMAHEVTIPCPTCQQAMTVSLADVRAQRTVHCPQGHQLDLVNEGTPVGTLGRAVAALDQTVKRLGRRSG